MAAHAAGECAGALIEAGVTTPALAMVAVTWPHAAVLDQICGLISATASPLVVVGVVVPGVFVGAERAIGSPAVGVLTWSPDATRPTGSPACVAVRDTDLGHLTESWSKDETWGESSMIVFADPFSVSPDAFDPAPGVPCGPRQMVGAFASGATRSGGTRLFIDGALHTDGFVGVRFPVAAEVVASHRSAMIGEPSTVTSVDNGAVLELDGMDAVATCERLLFDLGIGMDAVTALETGILRLAPADGTPQSAQAASNRIRHWMAPGAVASALSPVGICCDPPLRRGDSVLMCVADEDAASADLARRLGRVGWPTSGDALLAVAELTGSERLDDAAVLSANDGGCPSLGVVTEGVFHRLSATDSADGGELDLMVLRGGSTSSNRGLF